MRPTSRKWICDKVIEWLREDASVGPKELQRRIHHKYKVLVDYKRVFVGKELALTILCGSCEDSFDQLFSFKAKIERSSPSSFVVIDHQIFKRLFFALKACIDGFLVGCRTYLAIDSTFLTDKFKGQLATTCVVVATIECLQLPLG